MALPKLMTLKEAAEELGSAVTVKVLRAEVHAGSLRCVRLRPGRNAKIMLKEADLLEWLEEFASARQEVPPFDG